LASSLPIATCTEYGHHPFYCTPIRVAPGKSRAKTADYGI
jgi:hypothetical protein